MDRARTPVLVGVAQSTRREKSERQLDPIEMMAEVGREAARDAGLDGVPSIDTLGVVNCLSKALRAPTQDVAERLGIRPSWSGYTSIGATAPQWFVNRFAEKIAGGSAQWALVCGGEAFYTRERITQLTGLVQSHAEVEDRMHATFVGDTRIPLTPLELRYGLIKPVDMYALFENALRAHRGQTIGDQRHELADFCAGMSRTTSENSYSWFAEPREPDVIAQVTEANRRVSFPYTKLMCSNARVNQAAAVLMTSVAQAEAAGIAKDKMVFVRGCGDAEDVFHPSERPNLWASPSVVDAVNDAIGQASVALQQLDYLDLYSCFPSATRIVADMLGLDRTPPGNLTVTGGMACFGGPGNNYTQHAICTMVGRLRQNPKAVGMVHALSWYLSKHCVGVYSAEPGEGEWHHDPPDIVTPKYPTVPTVVEAAGEATVESYVLAYDRGGVPVRGLVFGRDSQQGRFLAGVDLDPDVVTAMTEEEIIGRKGTVRYDRTAGENVFAL